MTEKIALESIALDADQEIHLFLSLDTLGDDIHAQRPPEVGNGANDRGVIGIGQDVTHKCPVDLQLIDGEFPQILH